MKCVQEEQEGGGRGEGGQHDDHPQEGQGEGGASQQSGRSLRGRCTRRGWTA